MSNRTPGGVPTIHQKPAERWGAERPRKRRRGPRRPVAGWLFPLLLVGAAALWWAGWTPARIDRWIRNARDRAVAALELHNLAQSLRAHELAGGPPPRDLQSFLANSQDPRRRGRPPWRDPWGRDYQVERVPEGFVLRSAGPDKRYFDADDVTCVAEVPRKE